MTIKRIFQSGGLMLLLAALLTSCHGMWDEEGQDCTTHKRIRFTYDWNILYADAFAHEVKTLTLYAFDTDGFLAYQHTANADSIIANGGYMNVDDMPSGIYTLQVWAEGEQRHAGSYVFGQPLGTNDARSGLTAGISEVGTSPTSTRGVDVNHDLTPLYYGASGVYGTDVSADFTDLPLGGERETTVNLMKETENFRIVLQDQSGETVDPSAFSFTITDNNGFLMADNSLYENTDTLIYHAWSVINGETTQTNQTDSANQSGQTITSLSAVVAELTTNRMVKGHNMRLHVTRTSDGHEIINIPLIDLCLMVKGNYNQSMTDQEYLDRQDTWNLIFFIAKNNDKPDEPTYNWLSASIYVQSWRVVLQNTDLR